MLNNDEAIRLIKAGAEALQRGRAAEARRHFEAVTGTGRANAQIWGMLATACGMLDDLAGEETALDRLLALEPQAIRAHIMKADCRARSGDERGALGFYESALLAASSQPVPDDLGPDFRRAEAVVAAFKTRADEGREAGLGAHGMAPEKRSPRFRESLDILAGRKRIFVQEPSGYYFPGLANIQYFDRADFDWVPAVEAATGAIRDELAAELARGTQGFRPYLHGDPKRPQLGNRALLDNPDWSAFFLCENGGRDEAAIERCPRTWEAMQAAPLPHIANSPTVMFSLLRSGARIASHTGMLNTRLICHLPLIVPPDCHFRVGNEVRQWEEGKLIIFDDTIEHEAWNDSDRNRVVLIFDIWRPELSARERIEVAALLAGPLED